MIFLARRTQQHSERDIVFVFVIVHSFHIAKPQAAIKSPEHMGAELCRQASDRPMYLSLQEERSIVGGNTSEQETRCRRLLQLHLTVTTAEHSEGSRQGPAWHCLLHVCPQAISLPQAFPHAANSSGGGDPLPSCWVITALSHGRNCTAATYLPPPLLH